MNKLYFFWFILRLFFILCLFSNFFFFSDLFFFKFNYQLILCSIFFYMFLVVAKSKSSSFCFSCCKWSWYLLKIFLIYSLSCWFSCTRESELFWAPSRIFLPQLFDCLLKQLPFYLLLIFFSISSKKKLICSFLSWCVDFTGLGFLIITQIHQFWNLKYLSFIRYFQTLSPCCYPLLN